MTTSLRPFPGPEHALSPYSTDSSNFHKVFINRDAANIIDVRLGHFGPVDLGFQYFDLHHAAKLRKKFNVIDEPHISEKNGSTCKGAFFLFPVPDRIKVVYIHDLKIFHLEL